MQKEDYRYWLKLVSIKGLGPGKIKKLLKKFGSARRIIQAKPQELESLNYINESIISNLSKKDNDFVKEQLDLLEQYNVRLISLNDDEYPDLLKFIYRPPIILYIKGKIEPEDNNAFAIVGTRKASNYGKIQTEKLGKELTRAGFTIVSGLAYGIDAAAHKAALSTGGRTIAVCGTGLDRVYPYAHRKLARRITESGALISEFPLNSEIESWNFPTRNRIISGMCKGVLVVEGKRTSGALITAKDALEQNRDVFAIPGNIDSKNSEGTNFLIQKGAKLVTQAKDILEDYQLRLFNMSGSNEKKKKSRSKSYKMNENEQNIYALLQKNGKNLSLDEMVKKSKFQASELSSLLLNMELKGIVKREAQNRYWLV